MAFRARILAGMTNKKAKKNNKPISGMPAYDEYFTEIYGERWPALKISLEQDDIYIARKNKFYPDDKKKDWSSKGIGGNYPLFENCQKLTGDFNLNTFDFPSFDVLWLL